MFSFLPRWKLSSTTLNLLVSLYFTLALNIGFYEQVLAAQPFTGQPESYFLLTIPFIYFFALNIILNILSTPYLHKIIIPLLILISAAISYNSLFFNIYFDVDMLNNVLQTNFAESSRTLTTSFLLWLICLGVIPCLLYLFTVIEYKPWWKELLARMASVLISIIVILGVAKFYYQDYAAFFRNNKSLPHLITPSNFVASSIKKIRHHYRDNLPYTQLGLDAKLAKPDDYRHVTILVVGETTRAQNWG